MSATHAVLDRVNAVRGVRGSLLVSGQDGLIVAEQVMDGVDARAAAALAGSIVGRLVRTTEQAGLRAPTFVHLKAADGSILAALGQDDLVLVTIVGTDANIGLARLEMLDAVARLV